MIALRRLGPADWRDNRAIRLEALRDSPGNYFTSYEEAAARTDEEWRAMLADPDLAIFGLYDGEALAGLTAIAIDGGDPTGATARLAMSYIRPAWRRRGLAARLYAVRLDWARERGVRRIEVGHRASNEPSRRAMLAAGFTEVRRSPHLWPDGVEEDDVYYALRLA